MSSAGGSRFDDMEAHECEIAEAIAAATAAATAAADAKNAASEAEKEEGFICAICHDLLQEPVTTPCGHNFCKVCLHKWLANKAKCPLCAAAASLPLAVNKMLEAAIEANAGPLFLARSTGATQRFYDKLVALDPVGALAALSASVDVTRFVGTAYFWMTPLLWVCANAKGDKVVDWIALAKALIARPITDVHARSFDGRTSIAHVSGGGHFIAFGALVPLLMSKGAHDGHALGLAMGFRYSQADMSCAAFLPAAAAHLALAKDDAILQVAAPDRSALLMNTLLNGFDSVAVELINKGLRTIPASSALEYAATGGCAEACALLIKAPAPIVPVDTEFESRRSALHIACLYGHAKCALKLLAGGTSKFTSVDGLKMTPLSLCVAANALRMTFTQLTSRLPSSPQR